eukprot:12427060-Karenia_brevis.AAC.1
MPRRVDILTEIAFLQELTLSWYQLQVHLQIQPHLIIGPQATPGNQQYLRGKGIVSDREEGKHTKQVRRLTARSIMELQADGPFCIKTEGGTRLAKKTQPFYTVWACPKYDGSLYDASILRALPQVMLGETINVEAAKALGFMTSSDAIDHMRILYVFRHYTVIVATRDRIQEVHQDFLVYGESEHARWAEHQLGWQDHSPIPVASKPPPRQTGRKGPMKAQKRSKKPARKSGEKQTGKNSEDQCVDFMKG